MHIEQWIVVLALLGGVLFGLTAFFSRARRIHLAVSAAVLLLLSSYEIRMDRWEKTVTAPIRLDIFVEIPLIDPVPDIRGWQLVLCRKKKALKRFNEERVVAGHHTHCPGSARKNLVPTVDETCAFPPRGFAQRCKHSALETRWSSAPLSL